MKVEQIVNLARLDLSPAEKKKFSYQLDSILDYVKQLDKVETEKTEPIDNISGLSDVFREDEIKSSLSQKKVLDNAPEKERGYFKVKRVIE